MIDSDEYLLLQRDQQFFDALVSGDHDQIDDLLAADFVLVDIATGSVVTRTELTTLLRSGDLKFPAIESVPADAVVRQYGDVGIVIGRTEMSFRGPDGEPFTAASRYTHIYRQHAAAPPGPGESPRWQLWSAQGTTIAE